MTYTIISWFAQREKMILGRERVMVFSATFNNKSCYNVTIYE